MPTVENGMTAVRRIQGFVKVRLRNVGVLFGTKPLTKAVHRPAEWATPGKEAYEKMCQHAFALPTQVATAVYGCVISLASDVAHHHPLAVLHNARRVPVRIPDAGAASLEAWREMLPIALARRDCAKTHGLTAVSQARRRCCLTIARLDLCLGRTTLVRFTQVGT
jgi:hypothetical protein